MPVLIALMHDLLITAGVYSLTGREVTTSTVAALLTILGYSLYDTIIVFDRIRENVPRMPRAAFSQIVNRSMSEVLTRSLATSFCTLLPVLALLLFGGETLKDFAFALLVGIALGHVLVDLHRRARCSRTGRSASRVYAQRAPRASSSSSAASCPPTRSRPRGGAASTSSPERRAPRGAPAPRRDEPDAGRRAEEFERAWCATSASRTTPPSGADEPRPRARPSPAGGRRARRGAASAAAGRRRHGAAERASGRATKRARKPKQPRNRRHGRRR